MSKEAMKLALELIKLSKENYGNDMYLTEAVDELEITIETTQKAQDVSHGIIAGALFDFMGWLTSRPKRIMLSSADDASPAVDAIKDFAKMRGLSLDDARVQDWQEALAEQPAPVAKLHEQEPVAKVCHDLDGHIGWNPNLRQLPDEGTALYTSPPTLSLAQRPHECSRSHPHENMNAMCELRTEIARLTNENARLKALHQGDEINTYRMTLLCIRDGLQQGMSKSIQKLQAREINDVLGLPSFASYRTSPPAQRTWVGLTDEEMRDLEKQFNAERVRTSDEEYLVIYPGDYWAWQRAIEAKLREKNT